MPENSMRRFIDTIHDIDHKPVERPSQEWRDDMLAYARDEDQMGFTALRPEETGFPMTVYVSEWKKYPAFIVDSQKGLKFSPSPGSKAFAIGEKTGNPVIDKWVTDNLKVLKDYSNQQFSTSEFYRVMKPLVPARKNLREMANWDRGDHGVPLAFFVRPSASDRKGRHPETRIKVNSDYKIEFDPENNFSIVLLPKAYVKDTHNIGRARQSDVNGMVNWAEKNKNEFIEFIAGRISRQQLDQILKPY